MLSRSASFFGPLLILFISSSQTSASIQDLQQFGGLHQHAKRMNLPSMMAGGKLGSSKSQHHGPPKDPPEPLSANCTISALVPQTWKSLRLDDYLKNYPNGNATSLPAYAASKGLPSFECGIGQPCSSGQPCYPAALPDWYILFAVEQWNIQLNSMKKAIQWSANYVRSTISSVQSALFPAINTEGIDNFKIDFIENGACMMVSNTMLLDIFSLFYQFQDRVGDVMNIINNVMSAAFELGGGLLNAPKPPEGDREAFNEWTHLENQMVRYEKVMVDGLTKQADKIINAGISTDQGIYGQLKNGTYLQPNEAIYLPLVTDDLKNVTTVVTLVKVLRSVVRPSNLFVELNHQHFDILSSVLIIVQQDAFVTIGSDVCAGNGINGAFEGDDILSYCDTNGTMYNIVRVKNERYESKFENAWVISDHFGYSTQFLTNASISCQQKYGGFEHFPYKNTTLPRDAMADCIVNLPVCDLRNEINSDICVLQKAIKHDNKKHGIVAACRNAGLPI
ncbi:uncharacterized protein MELLADRAFT_104282 [Melampsora larici-populina 98AG31]|uniref:DUF7872 domain-containing protein n=1 Tax=Melampsora larici-populina (strain 98AG31 / pathotype 3-4-7) TaxID=747676 RepID=F4RE73_MELLP|nr:uncharacterized protein MELLADRAFT_104282 [Melampsora larici-populina 98AG31]EGG09322.1 hypothetical protein MELLADRAFT_104282 [Melampsora larici-populina 98AG31]